MIDRPRKSCIVSRTAVRDGSLQRTRQSRHVVSRDEAFESGSQRWPRGSCVCRRRWACTHTGTTVLRPGHLVVIAPGGWHTYAPRSSAARGCRPYRRRAIVCAATAGIARWWLSLRCHHAADRSNRRRCRHLVRCSQAAVLSHDRLDGLDRRARRRCHRRDASPVGPDCSTCCASLAISGGTRRCVRADGHGHCGRWHRS